MTVVYTIMKSTPFTHPELIEIYYKEVEAQKVCDTYNNANKSLTQKYYVDSYIIN